jgi:tetratricopeptide (TPR) repeat protein
VTAWRWFHAVLAVVVVVTAPWMTARAREPEPENVVDRDDPRYRELIVQAVAEFDRGHYQEALAVFAAAFAMRPSARVLRGLAKAHFELRHYRAAIEAMDRALASDLDPLDEELKSELVELRATALTFVGRLKLRVQPPDAQLVLDGRPLALPFPRDGMLLDMGPHAIEARARGREVARRTIDIEGGREHEIALVLRPLPRAPRPLVVRPTVVSESQAPLYVTFGIAVVGAAGIVTSAIWLHDRQQAVEECTLAAERRAPCTDPEQIEIEHDLSKWALGVSVATFVGAAVAATVLLVRENDGGPHVSLSCGAGVIGGQCGVVGTW